MAFRKPISKDFGERMNHGENSRISMNSNTSKGFSKWVNKDIRHVEKTGDWTALLEKTEKQIRIFRNNFYK